MPVGLLLLKEMHFYGLIQICQKDSDHVDIQLSSNLKCSFQRKQIRIKLVKNTKRKSRIFAKNLHPRSVVQMARHMEIVLRCSYKNTLKYETNLP